MAAAAAAAPARAMITEADIPELPPPLPPDASDEDKAVRKRKMAERKRVQKQLRDQQRGDRVRPATADDSMRRTALRLFQAARRRPLPRVQETTFATLWQLTKNLSDAPRSSSEHRAASAQLKAAWEAVLQRPCPAKVRREQRLERVVRVHVCRCIGLAAERGLSWTGVAIDSERPPAAMHAVHRDAWRGSSCLVRCLSLCMCEMCPWRREL